MLGWSGRTSRASLHANSDVAQHNCRNCNATNALVELEDMNSAFPPTFHYDATNALREWTSASLSLRFLLSNLPKKSLVGLEMGGQGIFL